MIALLCGSKISAVHCLVLSQSTRVTDKRTDGQRDGQTDIITTAKTALALLCRALKTTGTTVCVDIADIHKRSCLSPAIVSLL